MDLNGGDLEIGDVIRYTITLNETAGTAAEFVTVTDDLPTQVFDLNVVFISALLVCLKFGLPVEWLCGFILVGGFIQLSMHVVAYLSFNFGFSLNPWGQWKQFKKVLIKFAICLPSVSAEEIGLFVDTSFGSFLPVGSISLIYYANRFMGIPLGVFATAFSTILLPHFSRVGSYAPKRLSFYLLEATKFVLWVMIPVGLVMGLFSEKIFYTLFLGKKFTLIQVQEAGHILVAFLIGLGFSALNKVLRNVYYALHETRIPGFIAIGATAVNIVLNWLFITSFQAVGIALATSLAAGIQTLFLFYFLHRSFSFKLYILNLLKFLGFYLLQIVICSVPFLVVYYGVENILALSNSSLALWFLHGVGFWVWIAPLCSLFALVLYTSRRMCKVDIYFLGS